MYYFNTIELSLLHKKKVFSSEYNDKNNKEAAYAKFLKKLTEVDGNLTKADVEKD